MTSTRSRRYSRLLSAPVLLGLFYGILSLAWVLGNPVAASPDEPFHYLKALSVASGDAVGDRVSLPPLQPENKAQAWVRRTSRAVDVPAGLSPTGLACNAFRSEASAACQDVGHPPQVPTREITHLAHAQPTAYLVPGLLARLADNPVTAMQLGRMGGAAISIGLIWVAIALLWDKQSGGRSLVGLVLAVTPMAVFLASSLTASGLEVGAAICFFAAALRVTREPTPPTWTWFALGLSGALLAASRTLGPLWVVVDLSIVIVLRGLERSLLAVRSAGWRAFAALTAVSIGVVSSVSWELVVQPHGRLAATTVREAFRPTLRNLDGVFGQLLGVFGWLDSRMPSFVYPAWALMLAALVLLAVVVGDRRQKVLLVAVMAGAAVLTLLIGVANLAQTGHGMQGRYVLPLAVTIPLLAGDVLPGRRAPTGVRSLGRWVFLSLVTAGALHVVAWYANARRSALGRDGSWLFFGSPEWSSRTGWYGIDPLCRVNPKPQGQRRWSWSSAAGSAR